MRILYCSETSSNTGPSNAEKCLVEHWPRVDEVRTVPAGGALSKLAFVAKGLPWCDVVVSGGFGGLSRVVDAVGRLLGKPVVGFCHGYLPYENEVNRLDFSAEQVKDYKGWLRSLDAVATNSDLQRRFLVAREPSLAGKVESVMLGVDRFEPVVHGSRAVEPFVVAVSGGTRPIKGNDVVARAVGHLREAGVDVELRVYGRSYSKNPALDALVASCGRYMGQVAPDEFARGLSEVDVFVMDSRHESFGLSAIDALAAGCSLLLSANCGVKEVIGVGPGDVVSDCEDEREVAEKIEALLHASNCARLSASIDFDKYGWDAASARYRQVCLKALEGKGEK